MTLKVELGKPGLYKSMANKLTNWQVDEMTWQSLVCWVIMSEVISSTDVMLTHKIGISARRTTLWEMD